MVARSMSGNNLHFAWARCRLTVPGWQPAVKSFLISSIWVRGWCFGGSCSSAIGAVANASVTTHSSWPVIPFLGIQTVLPSYQSCDPDASCPSPIIIVGVHPRVRHDLTFLRQLTMYTGGL